MKKVNKILLEIPSCFSDGLLYSMRFLVLYYKIFIFLNWKSQILMQMCTISQYVLFTKMMGYSNLLFIVVKLGCSNSEGYYGL